LAAKKKKKKKERKQACNANQEGEERQQV